MKKIAFIGLMILGLGIGFTSKVPEFLQKQVQLISGMSHSEFDAFLNKKHYLVKSWTLDPKEHKALYETVNYQSTILNFLKSKSH